jgi:hypothetical protein
MKTRIITALAVAALTAGLGGRTEAGDSGYRTTRSQIYRSTRTVVESVGVPLLFYTSPGYSSSMYGSPEPDNSASVPTYYGSSSYSSRYRRYQYNPYYTDKVYVRYEVTGGTSAAADVQMALARRGYYGGAIDGMLGPMSRAAIWRYQESHGLRATGAIDEPLVRALRLR